VFCNAESCAVCDAANKESLNLLKLSRVHMGTDTEDGASVDWSLPRTAVIAARRFGKRRVLTFSVGNGHELTKTSLLHKT
jgi:hypothetical protein